MKKTLVLSIQKYLLKYCNLAGTKDSFHTFQISECENGIVFHSWKGNYLVESKKDLPGLFSFLGNGQDIFHDSDKVMIQNYILSRLNNAWI